MPVPPRSHPPEVVAECRQLYEETSTPNRVIAAKLGISGTTLGLRVHLWGWRPRKPLPSRAPAASSPVQLPVIVAEGTTAERIQRTVDRELAMIEEIVARLERPNGNVHRAERTARVLASLTRTLQEVVRLTAPAPAPSEKNDDHRGPADTDEFIRELARRMEAFAAAAARPVSHDDAPGGA